MARGGGRGKESRRRRGHYKACAETMLPNTRKLAVKPQNAPVATPTGAGGLRCHYFWYANPGLALSGQMRTFRPNRRTAHPARQYGKLGSVFSSTGTAAAVSRPTSPRLTTLAHLDAIVPICYAAQELLTSPVRGGTPYGATTIAGGARFTPTKPMEFHRRHQGNTSPVWQSNSTANLQQGRIRNANSRSKRTASANAPA